MICVRWRTRRSRARNTTAEALAASLLICTKRIVGRCDASQIVLKRVVGGVKASVVAAEPLSIPTSISLLSMLILAAATGNRAIPTCATLPAATVSTY